MSQVKALVLGLLCACSPANRAIGRCPTLPTLLVDGAIATAGLVVAVDRYNHQDDVGALAWMSGALAVAIAANLSECR